ncbi:MAG TPA: hypothetical protein VMY05_10145 [Acidobacteriota bacterium]|nr:hypothetical protein [Acidobacteriota bacterium]
MSDFNLYSVNWQDGMLITQQHLKDQERYFENLARWYAVNVGDSYGLIRKAFSGKPALSLNLSLSGNRLTVEVARCQALTPDGSCVEINESTKPVVRAQCEVHDTPVKVFIAVDATTKHEVGDPDPNEDVPRMPYLSCKYSLHLGTPPNLPAGGFLEVARLAVGGNEVAPTPNFYPACLNLFADERLLSKANEFRDRLEKLLFLSSQAYTAVTSEDGTLAGEKGGLQLAFKETVEQLAYHLSATLDTFVVDRNAAHPIQLVIAFRRLFRLFSTSLNLRSGLKDYLNEQFFIKVKKTDIRGFMSSLDSFLLSQYNHQDLGGHIDAIDKLLETLRGVLDFLAQVKSGQLGPQAVRTDMLTYLGKTYRLAEYSSSRLEQVGELSYLVIDLAQAGAFTNTVVLITKDLFSAAEWSSMQVRLGLNQARGLGETDPVDIDTMTFANKVALYPKDMLALSSVNQLTLIFRGTADAEKLSGLGDADLIVYGV